VKGDASKAGSIVVETDDYRENLMTRQTKATEVLCGTAVSTWVRTDDGRWLITSQNWTSKPCTDKPVQ
jgi:hypothetical protein